MAGSNDEIDLFDVFRKIGSFFGNLFSFIKNSIVGIFSFFIKNILIILFFTAIGLAGGFAHYYYSKPIYSSDLILSSSFLQNDMCAEIVKNLQWQVEDKDPEMLAKKLEISVDDAKKIVKIEFANYDDKIFRKYENKDTVILGLPFRIRVQAVSNTVFEIMQPALINYFDKNPNVIQQKNIRHTNNKLMIERIQKQLTELDTLKKNVAESLTPRGTQSGFVFGQPIDPLNIYREGITLYVDELSKKTDLILTERNINVLNSFETRKKPYLPRISYSFGILGSIGILLGFLVAYIRTIRKR